MKVPEMKIPHPLSTALLGIALLAMATGNLRAEPAVFLQVHRHLFDPLDESPNFILITGWDSHYVTEGRDNLSGEGLTSFTAELEAGRFLFGAWLTQNEDLDYDEQNYYAEFGFDLFGLDAYLGYNHLQLQSDGFDDNEIGGGLSVPGLPFDLVPAVDWYYSFDAGGSFAEFSVSRDFQPSDRTRISPALIFGVNDGYIADGHSGANHLALQLASDFALTDQVSLQASFARNFALNSDPERFAGDDTLIDFFYGRIALSITLE